jgi:hypothetical protein
MKHPAIQLLVGLLDKFPMLVGPELNPALLQILNSCYGHLKWRLNSVLIRPMKLYLEVDKLLRGWIPMHSGMEVTNLVIGQGNSVMEEPSLLVKFNYKMKSLNCN